MDLDLEIISEEGDCPDPLFNSIMNAMNSMKEATADKIYQKIQKEGETNYSKPQVDRALARALKYGIFEVRNNRYRVRDDMLDDEDTVYWKLKKGDDGPFLPEEGLNPERDNQRYKKVPTQDGQECPQCGRTKRPSNKPGSVERNKGDTRKGIIKQRKKEKKAKPSKRKGKTRQNKNQEKAPKELVYSKKVKKNQGNNRRRPRLDSPSEERQVKVRKISGLEASGDMPTGEHLYGKEDLSDRSPRDKRYDRKGTPDVGKFDSTDESEVDSMSSPSEDEQSFIDYREKRKIRTSDYVPQCFQDTIDDDMIQAKVSNTSFHSESESEKSDETSFSSHKDTDQFMESLPCTSRGASTKEPTSRNQFMDSSELYGKQYGREQVDSTDRKPDWMGYADQPQGNIIESNNVLTIEPMDSMGFKSQEQASYIS